MALAKGKPFLLHLLDLLKRQGIHDIVLCVGYQGEQIEDFFGEGRNLGLKIRYTEEREELLAKGEIRRNRGD